MNHNPYTCRLLMRVEWLLRKMVFQRVVWGSSGYLCRVSKTGVRWGVVGFFPDWMFIAAARIQNRCPWTRKVLSA